MSPNQRFVIDTNVLLVSISRNSPYHWIFEALLHHEFDFAVTSDILAEYEEVISEKYSALVARNVVRTGAGPKKLDNVISSESVLKERS